MIWTHLKAWACGLAALGVVVGGGAVAFQTTQAQSPPIDPGVKQAALRLKGSEPVPPKEGRDAEVEALKKEIEALHKKLEALGKKEERSSQEQRKIVVTSPLVKDVSLTQEYVCQIHSQRHIDVCALQSGYLEAIQIKEGQAVKEGDVLFQIVPTLYKAKRDIELAEVQIAQLDFDSINKLFKDKKAAQTDVYLSQAKLAKAKRLYENPEFRK